eukprot:895422-Pelagomonas_calceolata.AAC.1
MHTLFNIIIHDVHEPHAARSAIVNKSTSQRKGKARLLLRKAHDHRQGHLCDPLLSQQERTQQQANTKFKTGSKVTDPHWLLLMSLPARGDSRGSKPIRLLALCRFL